VLTIVTEVGFGQVEPYQQITPYSCSAASLLAILRHFGDYSRSEPELMVAVGVKAGLGASAKSVVDAARHLGFSAALRRFSSLAEARQYTSSGIPIIADVASWNYPGKRHFVVIASFDDYRAYVMDPNTPGNQRVLTYPELEERWTHRESGERFGVVVWK
jgi:ABC-type bacteriocin/lantibiotic exporter with double-glycine peptidase domain